MFRVLAQTDEPKTVTELAGVTGADAELLGRYPLTTEGKNTDAYRITGRLLKHLGAMGVVVETAVDTYRHNGLATTLSMPRYSDPVPCMYVFIIRLCYTLARQPIHIGP